MKQNESTLDRVIRLIIGSVLVVIGGLNVSTAIGIILLIVGIIAVFTGITGFCLIYKLFNFSTKK